MADFFDQDLILPGAITDIISSYTSVYNMSEFGSTDAVILMGTAFDGPVGKLVPIYTPEHGKYIFGPSFDLVSKKEATLVAGIQDAYDRGCRTIYAVRVSGTSIFKDYQLAIDTKLKLRVSGLFPSNSNKDIYMTYDNTLGDMKIKVFKPAARATIQEKLQGLVSSDNSIMVNTLNISSSYGLDYDSRLIDLIKIINENAQNNVIHLAIVDENGVDVTNQSIEAQNLAVGTLFPGLYTIGRDKSLCAVSSILNYTVDADINKPYSSFTGYIFKKLVINTDVSTDLPIYGTFNSLKSKFSLAGVQMLVMFDFLEVPGQIDYLFKKDSNDYNEVDCKGFELYKKLGSGFTTTAKAVYKNNVVGKAKLRDGVLIYSDAVSGITLSPSKPEQDIVIGMNITKLAMDFIANQKIDLYDAAGTLLTATTTDQVLAAINTSTQGRDVKIVETPSEDPNCKMELTDGIYSMLENVKSQYRVLLGADADETIAVSMPKKEDFKFDTPLDMAIYKNEIVARANISDNEKLDSKKYKFRLSNYVPDSLTVRSMLFKGFVAKEASFVDDAILDINTLKLDGGVTRTFADGSLFLMKKTVGVYQLYKYYNGSFILQSDAATYGDLEGTYIFANNKLYKAAKVTEAIEFTEVTAKATIGTPAEFNFIMVESNGSIFVYKVEEETSVLVFTPAGEISEVLSSDLDKTTVTIQSAYLNDNIITVNTNEADLLTLNDLIDTLNNDIYLGSMFTFAFNAVQDIADKDKYLSELALVIPNFDATASYAIDDEVIHGSIIYKAKAAVTAGAFTVASFDVVAETAQEDSDIQYNTSLYVPYKTSDTFDRHLAQHCTYTSLKTSPTHGILGVSKVIDVSNLTAIANKVTALVNMGHNLNAKKANGNDMTDKNNMPYGIGRNISVVVSQYIINTLDNYNFISNGAAGYAGFISQLSLDQSSTAQPISIPTPMYDLTNYQLEKLTQAGFVSFRNSYSRGYIVTDGVTQDIATSPFRRLSTTRIINTVEDQIRAAVEPFLGKENHLANRNAMYTAIKSNLDKMINVYLQTITFSIRADKSAERLGIVYIDYNAVPMYEIRQVRNSIKIRES